MIGRHSQLYPGLEQLLSTLIETDERVRALPPLTDLDRTKLEYEIAIDHLYYSSKLEGTALTGSRIEQAIHGEELSETKR